MSHSLDLFVKSVTLAMSALVAVVIVVLVVCIIYETLCEQDDRH